MPWLSLLLPLFLLFPSSALTLYCMFIFHYVHCRLLALFGTPFAIALIAFINLISLCWWWILELIWNVNQMGWVLLLLVLSQLFCLWLYYKLGSSTITSLIACQIFGLVCYFQENVIKEENQQTWFFVVDLAQRFIVKISFPTNVLISVIEDLVLYFARIATHLNLKNWISLRLIFCCLVYYWMTLAELDYQGSKNPLALFDH